MREQRQFRVDYELSEELEVNMRMYHGSVLSPFLSVLVVDVITELAGDGALSELQHGDE